MRTRRFPFSPLRAFLVLIWSGISIFAPAAPSLSLDDVLKQMDREQGQFQSLTASIERTKVTVVVNDHSTESGQIEVRRDGKMRIDLTSPDQKTILRDGDHIYVYTPKIRRVEEYDLGKRRDLIDQLLLLGFGTSGDSVKKSYLITLQGEDSLNGQRVVHLELTPRADDVRKQISKIELWLNEGNWLPAQQQLFETGSGDYSIIRYSNVARNVPIPDARFRPAWPKGVTRVKPQD
ncbi:MAG TPA: outer membrane lipoprotein carrier protein LolA [Candidatus Angelobacter sp.]|jgi:outer membrane lipoprotein-sorting protein|nr:outer membrane lipoprotein carrier protein LolA [Candidatus Angelobacter sp.]